MLNVLLQIANMMELQKKKIRGYLNVVLYSHAYESLMAGFGLVIEFIEHLQIVTVSNCSSIGNLHSAIHCKTY
jgi:hypothetical protein